MVRLLFRATLLALLLLSGYSLAQDSGVTVEVDRNGIARGETLVFTIRVYDQRQGMQLDLTPLTDDFDVLSTRTSSQIRSVNGAVESWTDYIVTLFPLNEGELEIPSLTINNVATDSIIVSVTNEGPRSNQDRDDLFLEMEVNKDSIYVQEQLPFTVRLNYTISGIRNPQFTELEMPETVIQLIGSPNQYEKLIDGVRYGVYEKRYVIFPQRSGPLEIPDILFRGEVTDGSSNFVFRNLNTRRVTAFIEGIVIAVKERPSSAQSLDYWLPAADLMIEGSWDVDISNLSIGDSAVRTVKLTADGLDGAVLPPFSATEIDGLNLYPEPPDIQRTFVDGSIVGTRIETTSMVPTESGFIQIPEISIPWWNINTDLLEYATIPATQFAVATVQGALPAEQTVASTGDLEELIAAAAPVLDQDAIDAQNEAEFIEVDARWMSYLIAFSIIVVLVSIYKLVIAQYKEEISYYIRTKLDALAEKYSPEQNERVAFNRLNQACKAKDLNNIRMTFITWCSHFFAPDPITTMEDILQRKDQPELQELGHLIQAGLFNAQNNDSNKPTFDGHKLVRLVAKIRKSKNKEIRQALYHARYALPPLYRT
ncbi:MAG: hypothetical protein CMQ17_10135 [Gammaproteobacteria bacterium]|jgi:hypothetical protein|nr:hypothetical protein [Gammaproteobacteria bacterium]